MSQLFWSFDFDFTPDIYVWRGKKKDMFILRL